MKIFAIILGAILLTLGSGCRSTDSSAEKPSVASQDTRVYEVFGMDCPGCHGGLEKLVNKLDSVQDAQADWQAKQVTVRVKAGAVLDDEAVYDAMRRANFTPGERLK